MYKFTCLDATNEEPSVSDGATTSCVSMYVCFLTFTSIAVFLICFYS